MTTARYVLHDQNGRSFWAIVTVSVTPSKTRTVDLSPAVFDWIKAGHGPDANAGTDADEYRAGALFGVNFALDHLKQPQDRLHVTVLEIQFHDCHSDPGCVAFAATHATWNALGDDGFDHPSLESDGVHFLHKLWPRSNR